MSPQLFFSIVVRLTQSQLQSWILSYEHGNANHSKGRVITVPLRHPQPLQIIINEQFCQEKKLKGPVCGVVMSVMTGVRWSKDKGLLTVTPPGSQSTLLACNFKTVADITVKTNVTDITAYTNAHSLLQRVTDECAVGLHKGRKQ